MDSTSSETVASHHPTPSNPLPLTTEVDHRATSYSLPEHPLVQIRPSKSWVALNLRDLWTYRELLYFLTWRDVKVKYKQTILGALWAIIQPLFTALIFTVFFGRFVGVASDDIPYPLFVMAGLVPWTFFSNSLNRSSDSLVGSANLITKAYFPRMIIPGAAVAAGLVDFVVALAVLVGLALYYGVPMTTELALLPGIVLTLTLLALGVGMWMSGLNVKYRDVRYAVPFLIQLLMFVTPIIYPSSVVPTKWRWIFNLNPLTGLLNGFRSALCGRAVDGRALAWAVIMTLVILVYAAYSFRRMEKQFADVV